jgi:HCOMODA/2-hydroxy-3-carboxy-muconic semialdehyde decarboxylase
MVLTNGPRVKSLARMACIFSRRVLLVKAPTAYHRAFARSLSITVDHTHDFAIALPALALKEATAGRFEGVDESLIDDLVAANRILFDQGVVDGFGHVSCRHPHRVDRFIIARSMAPALVTADDLLELDLDGAPVVHGGPNSYLERFIHCEIYRARPDVGAVVHSHSPAVIPFGIVSGVNLRPVCHMSGFLAPDVPVFEIRSAAGTGSDLLIRDRALGAALASSLGSRNAVLMRGHGSTVVATSIRQVVFRAVYTEVNARLQGDSMRMGPVNYLTLEEAAAASATNDGQINRAWELWKLRALAATAGN